jgi:hypothetical protein
MASRFPGVFFITLSVIMAAVLSACHKPVGNERELYLPNKQRWELRSPSTFSGKLDAVQKLSAEFNGQAVVMLMQLEIDKKSVRLAMLNPTMISLFSLDDDGEKITTVRSPLIPAKLDPKYVLADIQLSYWPLASLLPSLRASGLELSETTNTTGKSRQLKDEHGATLVSIDYVMQAAAGPVRRQSLQTVIFENHVWHYRYQIDTVSWDLQ